MRRVHSRVNARLALWCVSVAGCAAGQPSRAFESTAGAKPIPHPVHVVATRDDRDVTRPFEEAAEGPTARVGPSRPLVDPVPFRVADLQLVRLPDMIDAKDAPRWSAPRDVVPEVVLSGWIAPDQWHVVAVVRGLRVVAAVRAAGAGYLAGRCPDTSGGPAVSCGAGNGRRAPLPARWEGVTRIVGATAEKGPSIEYAIVDGWLDPARCEAFEVRRTIAVAKEIVPNALYAFRACGASSAEDEKLVLLMPPGREVPANPAKALAWEAPIDAPMRRVVLPLGRSEASAAMAYVGACDLLRWEQEVLQKPRADRRGRAAVERLPLFLGVEVSRGSEDLEPVGVAYLERMVPPGPGQDSAQIVIDDASAACQREDARRTPRRPR